MILIATVIIDTLRWTLPAVIMLAPAPLIAVVTNSLHILRPIIPSRIVEPCDEAIWSGFQRMILLFFSKLNGVEVAFSGDYDKFVKSRDNSLVISNHQTAVDWITIDMVAHKQNALGKIRFVLKDELKYIPLFGLYFWQHNCVNVGRFGSFNEEKMIRQLQYLRNNSIPTFMVIFPEATRYNVFNRKFLERSQLYAVEKGFTPLNRCLTPRSRGAYLTLKHLDSHLRYVYNLTIAYDRSLGEHDAGGYQRRNAPSMVEFITGRQFKLQIHVEEIAVTTIPRGEGEFNTWMYKLFQRKDKMLDNYYRTGQLVEKDELIAVESAASWKETLSPTITFFSAAVICNLYQWSRIMYITSAFGGTLGGMAFMAFH